MFPALISKPAHHQSFGIDSRGCAQQRRGNRHYIPDYSVGDYDNDGQDELIAALILKEGKVVLLTEPNSAIFAIELSKPEEPQS